MSTFDELFTAENKGNMEYNTWAMVKALCAVADEVRDLNKSYVAVAENNEAAMQREDEQIRMQEESSRAFQEQTLSGFAERIKQTLYPTLGIATLTETPPAPEPAEKEEAAE